MCRPNRSGEYQIGLAPFTGTLPNSRCCLNIPSKSRGVALASGISKGASQTDKARPSQYMANRVALNAGSPVRTATTTSSQIPENVKYVVKINPKSSPHNVAATVLEKTLYQKSLVCLLSWGRGKEIHPSSRAIAMTATAIAMRNPNLTTWACKNSSPDQPSDAPTNVLVTTPAMV